MLDTVRQDVRYAARSIRREPVFAAVVVVSLALGIGANTAIFSLIDTLMLRDLPVREPRQLVELVSRFPGEPDYRGFAWKYYEHYRDHNDVFASLVGASPARLQIADEGREAEAVDGEYVVGDFFQALGVQPSAGRLLGPDDDRPDANGSVAVVSWSYWNSRFGRSPSIVGTRILVDGAATTIVGVTPREFAGLEVGSTPQLWLPVASGRTKPQFAVKVMARLAPGVSIEQARAQMRLLDRVRVEEIARTSGNAKWRQATIGVEPAHAGFGTLRDRYAKPLLVLMAVVAVLLLLACVNIASLLLARGAARQREMAVRISLGAGRIRLVQQAMTEALLVGVSGGAAGLAVAYVGADALVRIITSGGRILGLPERIVVHVQPDARVLLFTAAVALAAPVLFSLVPAWSALAGAPIAALRESGTAGDTHSRRRFGQALIVAQVALSIVLVSAAGLCAAHLSNLRDTGAGFSRKSVLLVTLNPQGGGYNRAQLTRLYRDVLDRLHAVPGVRSATLSGVTPVEGPGASRFVDVEGFREAPDARRWVSLNWVAPRYFETLGTPLMAGRDFSFDDESRPRVAIVNQAFARYYFSDRDPVGGHVTLAGEDRPYEIVGVVGDAKYLSLHEAPPRTMYMNAFQEGRIFSQFAIRTGSAPMALAPQIQRTMRDVLKTVRVAKVTTMDAQVNASIVPERLIATLSGVVGGLGALLTGIGLYGLLAYTISRRTKEIGVRMALGATSYDVIVMVVRTTVGLIAAGLLVGGPLAWWTHRAVAALIEDVTTPAVSSLVIAALAMAAIACVAAFMPARRAARVQPMEALRHS